MPPDPPDDLPPGSVAVVARFEDRWLRGDRPDIADHLPPPGPARLPLLVELITIPDGADVGLFLVSDGKLEKPVEVVRSLRLSELFRTYQTQFTAGAKEVITREMEDIHTKHLARLIGWETPLPIERRGGLRSREGNCVGYPVVVAGSRKNSELGRRSTGAGSGGSGGGASESHQFAGLSQTASAHSHRRAAVRETFASENPSHRTAFPGKLGGSMFAPAAAPSRITPCARSHSSAP